MRPLILFFLNTCKAFKVMPMLPIPHLQALQDWGVFALHDDDRLPRLGLLEEQLGETATAHRGVVDADDAIVDPRARLIHESPRLAPFYPRPPFSTLDLLAAHLHAEL